MRENIIQRLKDSYLWESVRYDEKCLWLGLPIRWYAKISLFPRVKKLKLTELSVNWALKPKIAVVLSTLFMSIVKVIQT